MTDEEQIRRTLGLFCRFLDGRQFQQWAELFTEDGVFNDLHGRAAILENISDGSLARNPGLRRKHTNSSILIDVDGDQADVTCDLVMFDQIDDAPYTIRTGEYRDHLVRKGNRWLFQNRQLTMQPRPKDSPVT